MAETFDWVREVRDRGKTYPPRETAADLDHAEKLLGVPLPAGYRTFAVQFGLGGKLHSLPSLFPLFPPAGKKDPWWGDSVIDAMGFWRSPRAVEDKLPAEFLRHAIVFGCDEGALTFLFHTGEVTDPTTKEYRIYQIPRHDDPEPICESFVEWLRWVHAGYDPASWGDHDDEDFDDEDFDEFEEPQRKEYLPYARFLG